MYFEKIKQIYINLYYIKLLKIIDNSNKIFERDVGEDVIFKK